MVSNSRISALLPTLRYLCVAHFPDAWVFLGAHITSLDSTLFEEFIGALLRLIVHHTELVIRGTGIVVENIKHVSDELSKLLSHFGPIQRVTFS